MRVSRRFADDGLLDDTLVVIFVIILLDLARFRATLSLSGALLSCRSHRVFININVGTYRAQHF
jgi:hypothetical protein